MGAQARDQGADQIGEVGDAAAAHRDRRALARAQPRDDLRLGQFRRHNRRGVGDGRRGKALPDAMEAGQAQVGKAGQVVRHAGEGGLGSEGASGRPGLPPRLPPGIPTRMR